MPESEAPPVNFELSIALPLGAIANQLFRVEADLRFLNAKTSARAGERAGGALAAQAAARLEKIHEALESIRALLADIESDIQIVGTKPRNDRDD